MAKIAPVDRAGDSRTGSLSSELSVEDINTILGFPPNVQDDPDKVKYSWGFTIDGVRCGIWDYRGGRWSTFGPREAFVKVFGEDKVK